MRGLDAAFSGNLRTLSVLWSKELAVCLHIRAHLLASPHPNMYGCPQICLVAGKGPDVSRFAGADKLQAIARVLAHELGHYLMNKGDSSAHVDSVTNVMAPGTPIVRTKRDLTETEKNKIVVVPSKPDHN